MTIYNTCSSPVCHHALIHCKNDMVVLTQTWLSQLLDLYTIPCYSQEHNYSHGKESLRYVCYNIIIIRTNNTFK